MKPIQAGGEWKSWRSPLNKNDHYLFVELNPNCEADSRSGVVVLSDPIHRPLLVTTVKDLRKELPSLIQQSKEEEIIVYWLMKHDEKECNEVVHNLTKYPEFVG